MMEKPPGLSVAETTELRDAAAASGAKVPTDLPLLCPLPYTAFPVPCQCLVTALSLPSRCLAAALPLLFCCLAAALPLACNCRSLSVYYLSLQSLAFHYATLLIIFHCPFFRFSLPLLDHSLPFLCLCR